MDTISRETTATLDHLPSVPETSLDLPVSPVSPGVPHASSRRVHFKWNPVGSIHIIPNHFGKLPSDAPPLRMRKSPRKKSRGRPRKNVTPPLLLPLLLIHTSSIILLYVLRTMSNVIRILFPNLLSKLDRVLNVHSGSAHLSQSWILCVRPVALYLCRYLFQILESMKFFNKINLR